MIKASGSAPSAPQCTSGLRQSFETIRCFANARDAKDWRTACLIVASGIALTIPTTRQHAVMIVCASINAESFPEILGLLRCGQRRLPGSAREPVRCDSRTIQSRYGRCGVVFSCGPSGPSPFGRGCGKGGWSALASFSS